MNIRFHSRIARWWLDSQDGYILFTEWSDSSIVLFFYELQINQKLEMRLIEGLGTEAEDVRELILQLLGLIPQSNPTKVFYWTDFW